MRLLLVVVVLFLICMVGAGFYYGYFQIGSNTQDGKTHINLTVDQKKIQDEEKKVINGMEGKN